MTDGELDRLIDGEQDAHMLQAYVQMRDGCRASPAQRLWYTNWTIETKAGAPVGSLGFKGPPAEGEAEIGYGIDGDCQNCGYATEAVHAVMDWAFSACDELYFIIAEAEPDNAASRRVLEKLGFSPAEAGEKGDRFEKERPVVSWLSIYLCLGISVGVSFGVSFDKLALCLPLGMCFGLLIGACLDQAAVKNREAARAARTKKQNRP